MLIARASVIAVLAALLIAAAPAPADAAGKKAFWGPLATPSGETLLPTYRDLGVDLLQVQLRWERVALSRPADPANPADPAYRWPRQLDEAVRAAPAYGLRIALMVTGAPPWANGGNAFTWAPQYLGDYATFVTAAARRYPQVRKWMIWGEPQRDGVFEPFDPASREGPERYARMLDASYVALKRVSRRNLVIGGMTLTSDIMTPVQFLKWMKLPNGKPPRLDWFGHNPFAVRFPDLRQKPYAPGVRDISDVDTFVKDVRKVYRRIGRRPKLFLSEYTVQSDRSSSHLRFFVSRAEQARWLRAAYRIANRHRYISGLGWFNLQDGPGADGLTTGLLDVNGVPKPAYAAYKRVP